MPRTPTVAFRLWTTDELRLVQALDAAFEDAAASADPPGTDPDRLACIAAAAGVSAPASACIVPAMKLTSVRLTA